MKFKFERISMIGPQNINLKKNKFIIINNFNDRIEKEILHTSEIEKKIEKRFDKLDIWNWDKDYNQYHYYEPPTDCVGWNLYASINNKTVRSQGYDIIPDDFVELLKLFDELFHCNFYDEEDEYDYIPDFNFKFNYTEPFKGEIKIYSKNQSLYYESNNWYDKLKKKNKHKIFLSPILINSFEEFFNRYSLWYLSKDLNKELDIEGFRDGYQWSLKANILDKKIKSKATVLRFVGYEELIFFLNSIFHINMMMDIGIRELSED